MLTPTNLKITVASRVLGMHANPGIEEKKGGRGGAGHIYLGRGSGGMLKKTFEIFVP